MNNNPNCIFCASPLNGKNPNERLHLSRWIKTSNGAAKKERVIVDMPTCECCYHTFHPYNKPLTRFAAFASGLVPLFLLISLFEKDFFSVSPLGSIIILILGGGLGYCISYFLFIVAFSICDNTFSANMKAKPYCDMPIVQDLLNHHFEDGEGCNTPPKDWGNQFIPPIGAINEAFRKRYSCTITVEK